MGRPRKNEDIGKPWVVRDVHEDTRRKVRVYAAEHDMTMAQAVEELVDRALSQTKQQQAVASPNDRRGQTYTAVLRAFRDIDPEAHANIIQQIERETGLPYTEKVPSLQQLSSDLQLLIRLVRRRVEAARRKPLVDQITRKTKTRP